MNWFYWFLCKYWWYFKRIVWSNPYDDYSVKELLIRMALTVNAKNYCQFLDVITSKTKGQYNFTIIHEYPEVIFNIILTLSDKNSYNTVLSIYNEINNNDYSNVLDMIKTFM